MFKLIKKAAIIGAGLVLGGLLFSQPIRSQTASILYGNYTGGATPQARPVTVTSNGYLNVVIGGGSQTIAANITFTGSNSFTQPVTGPNGSASAPSFMVNGGATPTGIYYPAANTLGVSAGGVLGSEINSSFYLTSSGTYNWSSGTLAVAPDTALSRGAAGVVDVGTGAQGSTAGSLDLLSALFNQSAIGTTSTDSAELENTTASTSGVTQQFSPALHFLGSAWNTSGTPASNTNEMRIDLEPATGAATNSALVFQYRINGGSWTTGATLANNNFTVAGAGTVQGNDLVASSTVSTAAITATGLTNSNSGDYVCINTSTFALELNTVACAASSERFKDRVHPLGASLAEVLAIKPVSFYYRPDYGDHGQREQIGFTAENMAQVEPRLAVFDDKGEPSSVNYPNTVALLTKAIQEQQAEINRLQREINQLRHTH